MWWLLLFGLSLPVTADSAVILFNENSSFSGITNCSCPVVIQQCEVAQLLLPVMCQCENKSLQDVEEAAGEAELRNSTSWFDGENSTLICCGSSATETAKRLLRRVVDFAEFRSLTLEDCHNTMDNSTLTVYLRRRIILQETAPRFRKRKVHMHQPDWHNVTDKYRTQNVVFVPPDAISSNATTPVKSWSFLVSLDDRNMPKIVNRAFIRAPLSFNNRADRTFMATPLYV